MIVVSTFGENFAESNPNIFSAIGTSPHDFPQSQAKRASLIQTPEPETSDLTSIKKRIDHEGQVKQPNSLPQLLQTVF
ncbi:hypothetical protein PPEP_b1220 [Pseudoalteromonas peptidolytica F12-50-A1]|uniref:Uncharacterized protein n=1 Tax=Pseudoalteromonas peptidolytica F12-50-A1 TaxID=1315280 RepID=A0A8I0N174_9GAMM|nr:hypothetical protein [Pseudoalteromonas peptidolytica F12-50-A1]